MQGPSKKFELIPFLTALLGVTPGILCLIPQEPGVTVLEHLMHHPINVRKKYYYQYKLCTHCTRFLILHLPFSRWLFFLVQLLDWQMSFSYVGAQQETMETTSEADYRSAPYDELAFGESILFCWFQNGIENTQLLIFLVGKIMFFLILPSASAEVI